MPSAHTPGARPRGNVRVSLLVVALIVPLVLMAGLVLALDLGRDELRDDVAGQPAGDASGSPDGGQGAAPPAGEGGEASDRVRAGAAAAPRARLVRIGTVDSPLHVTAPPGDRRRLFVVEQQGRVRVLVGGRLKRRAFLDISGRVLAGGEQGLLSVAFAPDYARSGRFYVYFTDRKGDVQVEEYRRSARNHNRANRASRRPILSVAQPYDNHNGGLVLFGPDGYLYAGLGDGGSAGDPANNAQDTGSLLGKLVRIKPRRTGRGGYDSPPSNPFTGRDGRDEIYSLGLRNPWRFTFDRRNGDLYIGDVGQNAIEEIDYARRGSARGRNFGWSCFEGTSRFDSFRRCPGAVRPVFQYRHRGGACSVTGGVVVRDPGLPALAGRYVYGDFCRGDLRSLKVTGGRATGDRALGPRVGGLSSFGEDARGRVYVTSLEGPIYRLAAR